MAVTYKKAVDDNVDWQQRLANYAGNKDAGLSEYQRALEVYRGKSAAGDTAGADAAKKWSDQVNTAIGGIGNNRGSQAQNALDMVGQKVNAQPFQFKQNAAPFQYNAQADQSYQAALRQAQAGAQTATNNAMVGLGARGIGNSSVAVDRANQIQQKAIGNVNDTILPQLMQQAYARHQDQINNDYRTQLANYQASQDQIGNLSKYAGTLSDLDQRELDNQFRGSQAEEQQKQSNWNAYLQSVGLTGDLGTGAKSDYSLLGGKSGNLSLEGQQYADGLKQQEFENKLRSELQTANISNMNADNSRLSAPRVSTAASPEQKQAEKEATASKAKMEKETRGLVAALRSGDVDITAARKTIEEDLKFGFYTQEEAQQLYAIIQQFVSNNTPSAGQTANVLKNPLAALQGR